MDSEIPEYIDQWLNFIHQWYPDLHNKTYFLPPLRFYRTEYAKETLANQEILVPKPKNEHSDVRQDRALHLMLFWLRELAKQRKEVMMVISWLKFHKYLHNPRYKSVYDALPRAADLPREYHRGQFDLLIIHKKCGLVIVKIKLLGSTEHQFVDDSAVVECVREAVAQLEKTTTVLKHLLSDLPEIKVITVPALPFITSSQLQKALGANHVVAQDLRHCLGVQDAARCFELCLCSDDTPELDNKGRETSMDVTKLINWWDRCVYSRRHESEMSNSEYENIVARFCGPATTVELYCVQSPRLARKRRKPEAPPTLHPSPRLELRTEGEAVSEIGNKITQIALFPEQIALLTNSIPLALFSGPPGTGKTTVLLMQGLLWLEAGQDVHVVSTWSSSRAISFLIEYQLLETLKAKTPDPTQERRVHREHYNLESAEHVTTAVHNLVSKKVRPLCVLADEAGPDNNDNFKTFCENVLKEEPDVRLWAAAVYYVVKPPCFQEYTFTRSLRSPPVVVKEVKKSPEIQKNVVPDYQDSCSNVPDNEPPIIWINHKDGHEGHTELRPHDCKECGRQVANVLNTLGVNQGVQSLQYRDVVVLNEKPDAHCALVEGLRDCNVPVNVVQKDDDVGLRDTARSTFNKVTFTSRNYIRGLERKVVVCTGLNNESEGCKTDRLHSISRTTAQLVWIHW